MDPSNNAPPSAKGVVVQTTKAASLGGALLVGITQLPSPYAGWLGSVLIGVGIVGIVATQIPAPPQGSKLWPMYRVLNYLGANWGQAINAGMMMRQKK